MLYSQAQANKYMSWPTAIEQGSTNLSGHPIGVDLIKYQNSLKVPNDNLIKSCKICVGTGFNPYWFGQISVLKSNCLSTYYTSLLDLLLPCTQPQVYPSPLSCTASCLKNPLIP
jgi:hypothetical protein